MTRKLLPPLHDRLTRIRLLAWSRSDALTAAGDGARADRPSSRALEHNPELWPLGSYAELEHAMDKLRWMDRHAYRSFLTFHVDQREWWRNRPKSGLAEIARLMPDQVFVPAVIAEAAGYVPTDAKRWERKGRIAA